MHLKHRHQPEPITHVYGTSGANRFKIKETTPQHSKKKEVVVLIKTAV